MAALTTRKTPTKPKPTPDETFIKAYKALCAKHKREIAGTPALKMQIDGSFTITVRLFVRRTGDG